MVPCSNVFATQLFSTVEHCINRNQEREYLEENELEPIEEIFFPVGYEEMYPSLLKNEPQISIDRREGITLFKRLSPVRRLIKRLRHPRTSIAHYVANKNVSELEVVHYLHRISQAYPYPIQVAYRTAIHQRVELEDLRYGTFDLAIIELLIGEFKSVRYQPLPTK